MRYNKLVRDKIPEHISKKGGHPSYHVAEAGEYWEKLKEKLIEEVQEFCESESTEELADLLEVIDAIAAHKNFSNEELQVLREKKAQARGRFADRIILEEA